jgi:hypothetical protein
VERPFAGVLSPLDRERAGRRRVYKRLPEVLAAHGSSIRVKHTLRPLGVAMAGRDVHDPYKD